jgi:flagellar hook protein FlgE
MNISFYNGVSGIKTYQYGIDIWGDNIANINTTAYRAQEVDFKSLFSSGNTSTYTGMSIDSPVATSDIGLGSSKSVSVMSTKQGSIKDSDNVFDLAIEGDGFFKVQGANKEEYYTRAGNFVRDNTGTLVNVNGEKVLGIDAKTLKNEGDKWTFDSSIDTSNIFTKTDNLTPLTVPETITFPAQASKNISLGGNLNNGYVADNVKPADTNSDFGVLYNTDKTDMQIKNGQNLVFSFGNNISYEDGLIKIDNCINNDVLDGKEVNIDFNVNGENIKLTLPDGSTKQTIINAIANELDTKNILYDKTENGIMIKSTTKLTIKNNNGEFFPNASAEILTYRSNSSKKGEFTTINDFINELQNLANDVYPNTTKIGLDEKGKLYIQNDADNEINAVSLKANNTNDAFFENLGRLGNTINPHTASNSLIFNQNYQGFTGDIIDAQGNKNNLKFDFIKTKIDNNTTTWNATITETLQDGTVVSKTNQDFIFNKDGGLLSNPKTITIDNNGTPTVIDFGDNFDGLTSFTKKNTGFKYSQDGVLNGNLTQYDVNENGEIIANFSNGKSGIIGALPLFHFQNEQGLDNIGYQNYVETSNSGKAFTYINSEGKYILGAKIKNYALETSNVSMSEALTELIVMQKAFNSNAKSITTSDQMIQKAIDMKR